jgi:transcriptional regulator GlxA family with amidase domain
MPNAASEIGIVVYPGVQTAAVHGLTDLFTIANQRAAEKVPSCHPLRITHWQANHADEADYSCIFDSAPSRPPEPQVLFIPATLSPNPCVPSGLASWLRKQHSRGAKLVSVCSGAYILAETGLVNGRSISTHSFFAGPLASRYPEISIDIGRRIIDHGDITTAGGFLAWVDVGLVLVERFLGSAIRAETARFMLTDPESVEMGFKDFTPNLSHGDTAVLKAQEWVHIRDGREPSLAAMADAAGLERRTFLRRFAKVTGMTPIEYCRAVRIARARELLGGSDTPQKLIAEVSGYQDVASFARAFQKATGLAPGEYRKKFNRAASPEVSVEQHFLSATQTQAGFEPGGNLSTVRDDSLSKIT